MALAVFPTANTSPSGTPIFRITGSTRRPYSPVLVHRFGESPSEQRSLMDDREWTTWPNGITFEATVAGMEQIDDFLRARNWSFDPFLWSEPNYKSRLLGGPGKIVLSGGPTVWDLPIIGEGAGDYPEITGHQLYDDGVPAASTPIMDDRTFTTASISGVITVDYDFRLLVRLVPQSEPAWQYVGFDTYRMSMAIQEVVA